MAVPKRAVAPAQVLVSVETAAEIRQVAAAVRRSVAFVVERALSAAPSVNGPAGATSLELTLDEDDPGDLRARIAKRAGTRMLDGAVNAAWQATRTRFSAWVEREKAAQAGERADELDAELADASEPTTPAPRLIELANSAYPKVRALVAANPGAPADTVRKLADDREPYVRDAVENRRQRGG
jgi:hypothetical protein